jgi:hypothetical protein
MDVYIIGINRKIVLIKKLVGMIMELFLLDIWKEMIRIIWLVGICKVMLLFGNDFIAIKSILLLIE